jgi:hypothetical protein
MLMLNAPAAQFRQAVSPFLQEHGFAGQAELSVLRGGANNRVYRVKEDIRQAVLKQYFHNPNDPRDRFRAERAFYQFLWTEGVRRTPEPLGWESEQRLGLLSFLEGAKLPPEQVGLEAVQQAAEFIVELNRSRSVALGAEIAVASEACFSIAEHLECIHRRVARLDIVDRTTPVDDAAAAFVRELLQPAWEQVRAGLSQSAGPALHQLLADADRCLSPSDFGFHNALATSAGLRFFDFEYAGWDDPAKLVCDFFCQPELPVPLNYWSTFLQPIAARLRLESSLAARARLLLPAYQVKWCCIMLNDFVHTGHARREFALGGQSMGERKQLQLNKARQALATMSEAGNQ